MYPKGLLWAKVLIAFVVDELYLLIWIHN